MVLIARVQQTFSVRLGVADVFERPTVRALALVDQVRERAVIAPIQKAPEREYYPLSSTQRRMFAIHQANPNSVSYNMPSVFRVEGRVTPERFEEVSRALIARHASLRTSFHVVHGEPVAKIHATAPFFLRTIDSDEPKDELMQRLVQPFDLAEAPLWRVFLVRRSNGDELIVLDMHHIIADGTSMTTILREVSEILRGVAPPPPSLTMGDFALWQQTPEHQAELAEQRTFWLGQFAEPVAPLQLPYDFRPPAVRSFSGGLAVASLTKDELDALGTLARAHDSTPFATVLACWFVFLSRIGQSDDIVVGVPVAGRVHPDVQDLVGMFVNTVPWRARVPATGTFADFLAATRETSLKVLASEEYELEGLIEELGVPSLFDVMFTYQAREQEVIDAVRVKLHPEEFEHKTAKLDLTLIASESEAGLDLTFEYATELFARETVERLAQRFTTLVRDVLRSPTKPIGELELADANERTVLGAFNRTGHELPAVDSALELFASWVEKTPNAPAVVIGDTSWTYREVNARANGIASWLVGSGIGRNDVVAIVLDPCAEQLPAILGVLKAGAAFLPVDPDYPIGRKQHLIADSGARALLSRGPLGLGLGFAGPTLDVSTAKRSIDAPLVAVRPQDAAYVIYTSGSTGKPKGVVIEHGSLVNFAAWYANLFEIQPGDGVSKYAGFSFDASILEIVPAWIAGATLVVVPAKLRLAPAELSAYFEDKHVHVAFLPTQFGEQFMRVTDNRSLRSMSVGGEKLRAYKPVPYRIVNAYGPTEDTVCATAFVVDRPYDNIPIGKPIWNTQVHILDRHGRVCPIGITGELCITGKGVARGYLNRPELTAEKFVTRDGVRMYKTGDLARWRPDGNLEYVGRVDTQVKIRGFRIELGEIEQALLAAPGVSAATVIDVQDAGVVQLAAYYVGDAEVTALREAIARDLPDYMIPSLWRRLDTLPLTPNGKVDRRALPAIERDVAAIVAPATDAERALVACFASVLALPEARVSATASFFELGGHSLRAIALVGEIYKHFHVEVKVSDVFRHPSARALGKLLARGSASLQPIDTPAPADSYEASSVQTRMFLLQQMEPESTAYNVPSLFNVAPGITREQVEAALGTLADRYDAFRCAFYLDGNQVRLRTVPDARLALPVREVDALELVEPFDLGAAPLARAAWLPTATGNQLFFDMHHIVTDGGSMAILMAELEALLAGETLPAAPAGLVACTAWEHGETATALVAKQREFWRSRFPDDVPGLLLLTDFPRPPTIDPTGAVIALDLPADTVAGLRELSRARGLSLHALMLAAFDVFLARLARQDEVPVATPVSGRWHPDMQRTIGMFVNTLVLVNTVDPKRTFADLADEVSARTIEALDNQAFPFTDLVEMLGDPRHAGHTPLVDVMFAMQNADERFDDAELLVPVQVEVDTAKFDITLAVDESADGMSVSIEYRTSLYKRSTIERYLACYARLVADAAARPDAAIEDLVMVTDGDRAQITAWNQTDVAYPDEVAAHRMFERVADRAPERRVLVDGERSYTYGEVEAAANRLAHRLRGLGVGRDEVVAILTPPCAELIIAELAVLKAGGAFLPLDHRYPRDRLEYMLTDSAARVLISAPALDRELDWVGKRLTLDHALFTEGPATRPDVDARATDLAYIIYTSGSTGRPKGVMIEHGSLVPFIQRTIDAYGITERDRHSKYAGIGFDVSIIETFPPLCAGGELHIVPEALRLSLVELAAWLDEHAITFVDLPTQLAEEFIKEPRATKLRWMTVGGDRLRRFYPTTFQLANEYGPTEATVSSTAFVVDRAYDNIPIGKPIANTRVYILDPAGQLCPPTVPGELCVAGRGLARGYLGAPELTERKFVHDARFGRIYKTGDLGRWLDDGNIEFLGRIDTQVKIRGFRIELGEIEQAILEVAGIDACVVIDRTDAAGDRFLAGYYVAAKASTGVGGTPVLEIRDHLATRLPDYMMPVTFTKLDAIPLTTSGKVDRRRLPEPVREVREREIVPPANPAETLVTEAFARTLGRTDVGATDDFFELGGNSLKAVAVVAALASDFRITANDLFRLRTARGIAKEIPMKRGDLQGRLITLASELRSESGDPMHELASDVERYRARYTPFASLSLHRQMAYRDVLLTGATGFLGSFLLHELIERTDARVHVTIRAKKRQEAFDRLQGKTARYFGDDWLERHARRIHFVVGDLSEPSFGLDRGTFDALSRSIDCVVHAAALTKHYGDSAAFVKANVDATLHVCELARRSGCDFNMVSTISVGAGEIEGKRRALFTEFDCDIGQVASNQYVRTKLEAEKLVHALRDDGLACNIFRVGFLTGDSKTLRFQDNAGDSGFVQTLRSYLALQRIPFTALAQSFCPVDEVSAAIVRLLATSSLLNQTHHIDRALGVEDVRRILSADDRCLPMDEAEFYEWLAAHVGDSDIGPKATAMLLHGGLLDEEASTEVITLSEKTDKLLARAGFQWSKVRPEQVWSLAD
jgi:fengycin family lipopeptide synthetase D